MEFASAYNGIVGLETAFSLGVTHLYHTGILTPQALVRVMALNPATILRIPGGFLAEGGMADIAIADPAADVVYTAQTLRSKSKNSPFLNKPYKGKIERTIVGGVIKK